MSNLAVLKSISNFMQNGHCLEFENQYTNLGKKNLCKMTQMAFTSARVTGYLIKLQTDHRQVILGL